MKVLIVEQRVPPITNIFLGIKLLAVSRTQYLLSTVQDSYAAPSLLLYHANRCFWFQCILIPMHVELWLVETWFTYLIFYSLGVLSLDRLPTQNERNSVYRPVGPKWCLQTNENSRLLHLLGRSLPCPHLLSPPPLPFMTCTPSSTTHHFFNKVQVVVPLQFLSLIMSVHISY